MNDGEQNLKVLKIKSTCGCITTKIGTTTLKKGESTKIEVIYDSHFNELGTINKTIFVYTNDPLNHAQALKLQATLVQKQ